MQKNFRNACILAVTLLTQTLSLSAFAADAPAAKVPTFSLAWSEYPSWSVFGAADVFKLIDGKKGAQGPIEKKWGVDIELKEAEYDPCLQMYGAGQCDAVCITNMDVLNPALTKKSVALFSSSTSYGADACLVAKSAVADVKALRGKPVYGLEKSVSEYCFVRNLELLSEKESDHKFTNMDPGAAAMAMQQKQKDFNAIMVWNPFVLDTLNKRPDVKVLFDSRAIPGEIIDMIVMSQESLEKPGGKEFACAVIDTFFAMNQRLADPKTKDQTLIALGEKFSNLNLESMKTVVQQTRFYETPDQVLTLFSGGTVFPGGKVETNGNLKEIMTRVIKFCVDHKIVTAAPEIGYGSKDKAPNAALRFDPTYLELVKARPAEKK